MKKKFTFALATLLVAFFACQKVNAQTITNTNFTDNGYTVPAGDIVWLGTTLDDAVKACEGDGYVYLYNVKTGKFLNAGGTYGVHAVLSAVGMRLKVTQTTYNSQTVYTIMGRVDNQKQGSYMSPNGTGDDIYMDRKGEYTTGTQYSQPNWQFTVYAQPAGQQSVNGETKTFNNYRITNIHRNSGNKPTNYLGTSSDNVLFVGQNGSNNVWRIVSEADYAKAMDNVTWGSVDLGAFLKDAEFGRDNMDGRYWVWSDAEAPAVIETGTDAEGETYTKDAYDLSSTPQHWHQRNQDKMVNGVLTTSDIPNATIGSNVTGSTTGNIKQDGYQSAYAQYYAAEIYNEKITLSQELEMSNMENLKEGLYKMTAQALYYDDDEGLTNDGIAYFFVNTTSNVDGETVEKVQELPIIPMNKVTGNNITPHSGVSAGYVFDNDAKAYLLEFYIELKGETKITLGMRTEQAKGWTVIGNIHLYAHGKQALFLDEDWDENTSVSYINETTGKEKWSEGNPYKHTQFLKGYDFPATVYYNRTMTTGKWNPICLPIALTGAQVRSAFGGDCEVSEFVGLSKEGATKIRFQKVDLDTKGMEICKPYIIKPTREPDIAKGGSINLEVGNGGKTHYVTVEGPVYFIAGVTKESTEASGDLPAPKSVGPDAGGITFEGNFYKRTICPADDSTDDTFNQHNWVITKGDMYHLTNTKPYTLWGTYAYLHAPKDAFDEKVTETSVMSVTIEDADLSIYTDVEGLYVDYDGKIGNNAIYTLNGQKVSGASSLDRLPKGIYLLNGKKYVVR